MRPASLVAWRCASLKYAGTVMTALGTSAPKYFSAFCFNCRKTKAEISGGVKVRSPNWSWITDSLPGAMWNGNSFSSSWTSARPRPIRRFTE